MYKMKADGVVFYDPSSDDTALHVLYPRAKYELNRAGSLKFTMLPGNVAYDKLQKMKTIVTLEQDDEVIFTGRVLETTTDLYNQKEVYCEGELAYLLDSLVRPYTFTGKAADLFRQIVTTHNEQVEGHKQFQVGIITAVDDEDDVDTESEDYSSAMAEMRRMLIGPFGGYLRIRTANRVRYLDYIEEYTDESKQPIEFGVNLVDLQDKFEADDVCSVLIPIGDDAGDGSNPVTIESVNGGNDYLEDAELIAKYGRIIKSHQFYGITDPQKLKTKALERLAEMKENRTITIKAVDMHIVDKSVDSIRLGDKVRLISSPHELPDVDVCSAIDLCIEEPDTSEYTFGIPPESLTGGHANRMSAAHAAQAESNAKHRKCYRWISETDHSLTIAIQNIADNGNKISNVMLDLDAAEAAIQLKADQTVYEELEVRMSEAEIMIDGANAAIDLRATRAELGELEARVSDAEVLIDGANAEIAMRAYQSTVDAMGERLSTAEVRINGAESKIEAKADLILLDGYVKASELETSVLAVLQYADLSQADLDVGYLDASSAQISTLDTNSITTNSLSVGGNTLTRASKSFITSVRVLEDSDGIYGIATDSAVIYYYT